MLQGGQPLQRDPALAVVAVVRHTVWPHQARRTAAAATRPALLVALRELRVVQDARLGRPLRPVVDDAATNASTTTATTTCGTGTGTRNASTTLGEAHHLRLRHVLDDAFAHTLADLHGDTLRHCRCPVARRPGLVHDRVTFRHHADTLHSEGQNEGTGEGVFYGKTSTDLWSKSPTWWYPSQIPASTCPLSLPWPLRAPYRPARPKSDREVGTNGQRPHLNAVHVARV